MFSAMFAITVIFGIALCNLFLGFASALLIGRGPKSWADVEDRVQVRWIVRRSKGTAEPLDNPAEPSVVQTAGRAPSARATAPTTSAAERKDADRRTQSSADTTPGDTECTDQKMEPGESDARPSVVEGASGPQSTEPSRVIQVPRDEPDEAARHPQAVLEDQLAAWISSEEHEKQPSAAILDIDFAEDDGESESNTRVLDAIATTVSGQLRKDRRVVRPVEHQFAWFADDMEVRETLTPVQRIRQLVNKTRFTHDDRSIPLEVRAAVVTVDADDTSKTLLERLQQAITVCRSNAESHTVVDEGEGPKEAEPVDFDVDEVQCEV